MRFFRFFCFCFCLFSPFFAKGENLNIYTVDGVNIYARDTANVIVRFHLTGTTNLYYSYYTSLFSSPHSGFTGQVHEGVEMTLGPFYSSVGLSDAGRTSMIGVVSGSTEAGVTFSADPVQLTWVKVTGTGSGLIKTFYQDVYVTPPSLYARINFVVTGGTYGGRTFVTSILRSGDCTNQGRNVDIYPGAGTQTVDLDVSAWLITGLSGWSWSLDMSDMVWLRTGDEQSPQVSTVTYTPPLVPASGGLVTATVTFTYPQTKTSSTQNA